MRWARSGWRSNRSGRATQTISAGASREAGRDVEEQVQQRGLGQVRVVDDHDQRLLARERVDQPQERPARVLPGRARLEADGRRHLARHGRREPERRRQLVDRALAHRLQDDLAQRPVRDALAVGRAAAGQHARAVARDRRAARRRGATCRCPARRRSPSAAACARRPRARRPREAAELVLAPDQRTVELAPDRRGVRVDAVQQEVAVGQRGRRARRGAPDARSPRPSGSRRREPSGQAARPRRPPRRSPTRRRGHAHDLARADAAAGTRAERELLRPGDELRGGTQRALCDRPRARADSRTPTRTASPRSSAALPP